MPMEYSVPIIRIIAIIEMTDGGAIKERLLQLVQLDEEHFPQVITKMLKNNDRKYGMTNTLRISNLRSEDLSSSMIVSS